MGPVEPTDPGYHVALVAARKRALARLTKELDAVLLTRGYQRKGSRWSRTGWFATTFVEIQKSRYGLDCYINLGRDPPDRTWRRPSYRENGCWRIGALAGSIADANRLDRLPYFKLDSEPALLEEIVALVADRAVPFLRRCQGPLGAFVRMPAPK